MKASQGHIFCDHPGGNIRVLEEQKDRFELVQDLRDTSGWWFYWNFRAEGLAGRQVEFHFNDGNVVGYFGPAVSADGIHWRWLGKESLLEQQSGFRYQFGPEEEKTYFAFSFPYQLADFQRFVAEYENHPALAVRELCTSPKGRIHPLLSLAEPGGGEKEYSIVFTCRHHCCESTASYLLEGALREILSGRDCKLLKQYDLFVSPFMDLDGVEDGDQGKNRIPHDHNRDYLEQPLYTSVAKVMELCRGKKLIAGIDFHSPWLYGGENDQLYVVKGPEPFASQQDRFAQIFEETMRRYARPDSIRYDARHSVPFGGGWNVEHPGSSSFFRSLGALLAFSLETPYFGYCDEERGDMVYTPDNLRQAGRCFALALEQYLEQLDVHGFIQELQRHRQTN